MAFIVLTIKLESSAANGVADTGRAEPVGALTMGVRGRRLNQRHLLLVTLIRIRLRSPANSLLTLELSPD